MGKRFGRQLDEWGIPPRGGESRMAEWAREQSLLDERMPSGVAQHMQTQISPLPDEWCDYPASPLWS